MNAPSSDRNLLLGIIALQMDFIRRDGLIAAMHAWTLEKVRPLSEILVERGDLDPADRSVLENLVDRHVARHGGDPGESLSSLDSVEPIRIALEPLDDPSIHASLGRLGKAGTEQGTAAGWERTASYQGVATVSADRYQVIRLHDEGGLGCVFLARDTEIKREVALKQLKEGNASDAQSRARFLQEAEITGNLEHPGIVPVYGKGLHEDGRPYYAMRFVRGETLKLAIDRFHAAAGPRVDPGEHRRELHKLLRRLLVVCETMAYVHNRGVIHRDLKPRNILLGPYGETLIVDWGLAKLVGRDQEFATGAGILRLGSGSDLQPTMAGSRFGTPEYMSPEQARGEVDRLGPATDIYSLGATLYYLLTGQHAIRESDPYKALERVERGAFPHPRAVKPGADPALSEVCVKAMALRPEDRYPTCHALAEEIENWLADQPVSAYREPWTTRAMRGIRRHRHVVASAAIILLLVLIGLALHDWRLSQENARVEHARLETAGQLEMTLRVLKGPIRLAADRLAEFPNSADLREELARRNLDICKSLLQTHPDDPDITFEAAEAYRVLAGLLRLKARVDEALAHYRSSVDLFARLVEHPTRKYSARRGLVNDLIDRGELYRMNQSSRLAVVDYQMALRWLDRLKDDPDQSYYVRYKTFALIDRFEVHILHGRPREAFEDASAAVAIQSEDVRRADPAKLKDTQRWLLAITLADRGIASKELGQIAKAKADFRRALEVAYDVCTDWWRIDDARFVRAVTLTRLGEILVAEADGPKAAMPLLDEAIALLEVLTVHAPEVPLNREELAYSYSARSRVRLAAGDIAGAEQDLRFASERLEKLRESFPRNPQYPSVLAGVIEGESRIRARQGRADLERRCLDRAAEFLKAALALDPDRQADRDHLERLDRSLATPGVPAPPAVGTGSGAAEVASPTPLAVRSRPWESGGCT